MQTLGIPAKGQFLFTVTRQRGEAAYSILAYGLSQHVTACDTRLKVHLGVSARHLDEPADIRRAAEYARNI